MSASALSNQSTDIQPTVGARKINIRKDLGRIADLLEIAFGNTMDANGRGMLRELRTWSRSGPLLWLASGLDKALQGFGSGYVWIDADTEDLVGNISIYPTAYDKVTWVIANVAVHPDYQRRGIARRLMVTGLKDLESRGAQKVILQVEAQNYGAQRLYEQLGFKHLRTFTRWRRRPYTPPPEAMPNTPRITMRRRGDWQAQLQLAQLLRPNERGGLAWSRPTRPAEFKAGGWKKIGALLSANHTYHWVLRNPVTEQIDATAVVNSMLGRTYARTDVLVAPDMQGQLEKPLLNYLLRFLYDRNKGCFIQHPSDDRHMRLVLQDYGARGNPPFDAHGMATSLTNWLKISGENSLPFEKA